jgi:hypothetical protein
MRHRVRNSEKVIELTTLTFESNQNSRNTAEIVGELLGVSESGRAEFSRLRWTRCHHVFTKTVSGALAP